MGNGTRADPIQDSCTNEDSPESGQESIIDINLGGQISIRDAAALLGGNRFENASFEKQPFRQPR